MSIRGNIDRLWERMDRAAVSCGRRSDEIRLVVVTKTQPIEKILEAADSGAQIIGENYVQEAQEKINVCGELPVEWHFIGHLQTNKAKYAVRLFDLIHTVDSLKLARELDRQAAKAEKHQKILVQVNISGEDSKSGITPEQAPGLIEDITKMKHLELKGLMTMPPFFNEPQKVRPFFSALRRLRDEIQQQLNGKVILNELSMGMTGDYEVAIAEGATLVRVGTAIFGERS